MSVQVNDAIILLAGMGSRLKPLTEKTHKALIHVGAETILERQIMQLEANHIKNVHLVLGYRAEDIKNYVEANLDGICEFYFYDNPNFSETNTGYSLWQVLKKLDRSFLLLDGDVMLHDDHLKNLCLALEARNLLLCDTHREKLNTEAVKCELNANVEVMTIGKGIALDKAAGESIGVGLYQKDWAEVLLKELNSCMQDPKNWQWYYEDVMQSLIERKLAPSPLSIVSTEELPWVEIDDAKDLETARQLFG